MDKSVSAKIANLGLVAAVFVVAIHVKWPDPSSCGVAGSVVRFLVRHVARCAVPFFFGVSGYLLAKHFSERGWWMQAVRKRIVTLGIPFVLWGIMFLCWMACVDVCANVMAGRPLTCDLRGAWGSMRIFMGANLFFPPGLVPLWYVRNLLILVAISPIVNFFVGRFGWKSVGVLVGLEMAVALMRALGLVPSPWTSFLIYGFSSVGLVCFATGIALRRRGAAFLASVSLRQSAVFCLALTAALDVLGKWCAPWAAPFCVLQHGTMILFAWKLIGSRPWPEILTGCAFPIFLMHCFVIDAVRVSPLARQTGIWALVSALLVWMAAILLPLAMSLALARFAPRSGAVLFGGRVGVAGHPPTSVCYVND